MIHSKTMSRVGCLNRFVKISLQRKRPKYFSQIFLTKQNLFSAIFVKISSQKSIYSFLSRVELWGLRMSEQRKIRNKFSIVLVIVCAVLVVVIALMYFNYIPTQNSNREPNLINVGLGGRDLGSSQQLHIEGYVCNVGVDTAYKAKLHVYAEYVTGAIAIDAHILIGTGTIYGGDSTEVDKYISYAALEELGSWTLTPEWSNTP